MSNYARNSRANLLWLKYLGRPLAFILFGFGVYAGFRFWKRKKAMPVDINEAANKVNGSAELQKIARELAHHLGTGYFFLHWRSWSENDKEAYELLKDLDSGQFAIVARLYNQVYAPGLDLKADLNRLLDDEYKKQLNIL